MKTLIPHLSYSRMSLWEKNKQGYCRRYIFGQEFSNKYTEFGKYIHQCLEKNEKTKDKTFEKIRIFLPDYKSRERKFKFTKEKIKLLMIVDGVDMRKKVFGDIKCSKKWTQDMADKSDQITFYSFLFWLITGKIFKANIHWFETEEIDGELFLTGKFETFETIRKIEDFLKLWPRIKRNWKEINEFTINEYLKL